MEALLTSGLSIALLVLDLGGDLNRLRFPLGGGDMITSYAGTEMNGDGAVYGNTHFGYPFGSESRYFPTTEFLHNAIAGIVTAATDNPFLGWNFVYALSFPGAALSALWVFRLVGVRGPVAVFLSLVLTALPFHWLRIEHTSLATLYSAVLGVGLAILTGTGQLEWQRKHRGLRVSLVQPLAVALLIALSGVYFAFFTVLLCGTAFLYRLAHRLPGERSYLSALPGLFVAAGIAAAIAPAAIYQHAHPSFEPIAKRQVIESVAYSGNLVFALAPSPSTFVPGVKQATAPLADALTTANNYGPFGVQVLSNFGSLFTTIAMGFTVCGWIVATRSAARGAQVSSSGRSRSREATLGLVGLLLATAVLFFVPWGLNVAFAALVSPQIRGWDRLVVVLLFLFLVGAAVTWRDLKFPVLGWRIWLATTICFTVLVMDSVLPYRTLFTDRAITFRAEYDASIVYATALNDAVPGACGVLEIPYVDYPEGAPVNGLPSYDALWPGLTNSAKSWSHGAMKGTLASEWARQLGGRIDVAAIRNLRAGGFCAIHLDLRGYTATGGQQLTERLTGLLGAPAATGHGGQWLAYRLSGRGPARRVDLSRPQALPRSVAAFFYPVRVAPSVGTAADPEQDDAHRWWWLQAAQGSFQIRSATSVVGFREVRGDIRLPSCVDRRVTVRLRSGSVVAEQSLALEAGRTGKFQLTLDRPVTHANLRLSATQGPCSVLPDARRLFTALVDPVVR